MPPRLTRSIAVVFLVVLVMSGCVTTGSPSSAGRPGLGRAPIRGIVGATSEGELGLDLQGLLLKVVASPTILDQLDRIPGAYVEIRGAVGAASVRVRAFEILDAGDGLRPMVGTLVIDQSGVMLADEVTGTRLALRGGALAKLKDLHDARVWLTGTVVGPSVMLVAHWGLLVPPP